MATRQIPARDVLALKQASQDLVELAGGVKTAADLTQASPSRVSEACSPFHDGRFLTLIQVADLEAVTGRPVVTQALAQLHGRILTAAPQAVAANPLDRLAQITLNSADCISELAVALGDGRISDAEKRSLRRAVHKAIEGLQGFDADLQKPTIGDRPSLAAVK